MGRPQKHFLDRKGERIQCRGGVEDIRNIKYIHDRTGEDHSEIIRRLLAEEVSRLKRGDISDLL